jgi:glycine/D-amino acid oxidase-like deaminating enzyme
VETDQGEIETETVVNAAGVHAARIGALVDLNVPVEPNATSLKISL